MNHDEMQNRKATLRRRLILEREAIPPATVLENSRRIVARLMTFEPLLAALENHRPATVGLYAAFRGEPDIRPLTGFLLSQGATVAFPAIVGRSSEQRIRFGVYDPSVSLDDFLQPGFFGVPEPPVQSLLPDGHAMSILLVPGAAFDEQGGRMGFGKGFYDRLIAGLPVRPLLIGVAHPFQVQAVPLPMSASDQRMDCLVLPDRTVVIQWSHEG